VRVMLPCACGSLHCLIRCDSRHLSHSAFVLHFLSVFQTGVAASSAAKRASFLRLLFWTSRGVGSTPTSATSAALTRCASLPLQSSP
jgi:hypothetical protein